MAVQNHIVKVQKRNRALVRFDQGHIARAVLRAAASIGGFPMDLLPVAQDPGSNQICISAFGVNNGAVLFWDKESESFPDSGHALSPSAAWRIAASWHEFIELLHVWKRPSSS